MSSTAARSATIPPFWTRLRAIALYPMRGSALISVVVLTLGSLLGYLPILGFILELLIWLAAYKFAFEILRHTADGHMEAPETVLGTSDGTVWRLIALQFVFMLIVMTALALGGPVPGLLALVLVVLMQPGCIMSLAIDGSFGHAIDPTTSIGIMQRIGGPYFAVFGLLLVIQGSAATAGQWVSALLPPVLDDLAITLFSFWGLFATFHLMGYLVYQYHEVLGYEPARHDPALAPRADRDQALVDRAEQLVRDGDAGAALALLREAIRERAVSLQAHELLRRLLRSQGDAEAMREHARLYLNLLMMEKQDRRALALAREALDADPRFVPMQIEHGEQLAQRARLLGQSQLARDLLLALIEAHPRDASVARWGLEAATLMADRLGEDTRARVLLERVRERAEDAALREKIDAMLTTLRAVGG